MSLAAVIFWVTASSGALITLFAPRVAFMLLIASLGASGLYLDIGVSLSLTKLLCISLIPVILLRFSHQDVHGGSCGILLAFLAYGFLLTLIVGSWDLINGDVHSDFRSRWRWLIQAATLVLTAVPFLLGVVLLRARSHVDQAITAFSVGATALAVIGLIQWILKVYFEVSVLEIAREGVTGTVFETSHFELGDFLIDRINSLAREPKDLGTVLAVALVILCYRTNAAFKLTQIALISAAMLLTYSTTALVIVAIGLFVFFITRPQDTSGAQTNMWIVGIGTACAVALLVVAYELQNILAELIDERLLSRLYLEDYDEVTVRFLVNEPWWTISGVGAGMLPRFANAYLPNDPIALEYMSNFTWDAKSGLLKWLGSFGVVGTTLAVLLPLIVISRLRRLQSIQEAATKAEAFFWYRVTVFVGTVQLARALDEMYWALLGLAFVFTVMEQRKAHTVAPSLAVSHA